MTQDNKDTQENLYFSEEQEQQETEPGQDPDGSREMNYDERLAFSNIEAGIKSIKDMYKSMDPAGILQLLTDSFEAARQTIDRAQQDINKAYKTLATAQELQPFIQEELKKPEYEGLTLEDLLNKPGNEKYRHLFQQLIDTAQEARKAAEQEQENKKRRTKARAGEVIQQMPGAIAIPTLNNYEYATSFYQQGNAYMLLTNADTLKNLTFKDGKVFFKGKDTEPIGKVELQNIKTKEGIESIDLPLLRTFYSIILKEFEDTDYKEVKPEISIYLPDLAECLGTRRNLNEKERQEIINKTQAFQNIIGILRFEEYGKQRTNYYAMLNFQKYDEPTNTITFSSPYMNMVIQKVFELAIKKKKGEIQLNNKGLPDRKPTHSYLPLPEIASERNKGAVENVFIICAVIEKAGNNVPNISAATIIDRNPPLKLRLENTKKPGQLLKTCFTKTWELLRDKTRLMEYYKNIELPDPRDPANIPTPTTLKSTVYRFPHEGKNKEKEE